MKKISVLCLIILLGVIGLVSAEESRPFQLSIWNPIQIFPAKSSIGGLRLNLLYGDNKDVSGLTLSSGWARTGGDMKGVDLGVVNWRVGASYGFKLGLINYTGKRSVGLEIGAVNIVKGDTTGVQLGIVNWNEGFFHGWLWQLYGLFNYQNGSFVGMQNGCVNIISGDFSGLQDGVFNRVNGIMTGVQCGLVNYAATMKGVQLGLFNASDSLNGLQIGLGNYAGQDKPREFMPLVNWSF